MPWYTACGQSRKIFSLYYGVFKVKLGRRKDMITLSNMESFAGEVIDDEYVMDVYEPSVKMSTYLLAFIVCEFSSIHDPGKNDP